MYVTVSVPCTRDETHICTMVHTKRGAFLLPDPKHHPHAWNILNSAARDDGCNEDLLEIIRTVGVNIPCIGLAYEVYVRSPRIAAIKSDPYITVCHNLARMIGDTIRMGKQVYATYHEEACGSYSPIFTSEPFTLYSNKTICLDIDIGMPDDKVSLHAGISVQIPITEKTVKQVFDELMQIRDGILRMDLSNWGFIDIEGEVKVGSRYKLLIALDQDLNSLSAIVVNNMGLPVDMDRTDKVLAAIETKVEGRGILSHRIADLVLSKHMNMREFHRRMNFVLWGVARLTCGEDQKIELQEINGKWLIKWNNTYLPMCLRREAE